MRFSRRCVSPGSAEALVKCGGKIKYYLTAYFLANIAAKNYQNLSNRCTDLGLSFMFLKDTNRQMPIIRRHSTKYIPPTRHHWQRRSVVDVEQMRYLVTVGKRKWKQWKFCSVSTRYVLLTNVTLRYSRIRSGSLPQSYIWCLIHNPHNPQISWTSTDILVILTRNKLTDRQTNRRR